MAWWARLRDLPLKPYDFLVLLVAAGVIVAFSLLALERSGPPVTVEIRSDRGDRVYALAEDRTITVSGPLGDTILEIRDGAVRFVDSPCRDRICVAAGELSATGQWAACLPNRVFATVTGAPIPGAEGVDASTF
ncbi:MAG: NusG domain II-containing protein [Spirochaetaceae bacterium]|nr:MAG: NusG domain II-containing protein [Spirochaetaceae bacterium]